MVRRLIKELYLKYKTTAIMLRKKPFKIGSPNWLIAAEFRFGGYVQNVTRNKVSSLDPRSTSEILYGGMIGGDRMLHNGYAKKYSDYILARIGRSPVKVIVEFGILKGTGLAIWSELFPEARVIGFDIDLNHTKNNLKNLKSLGAFQKVNPELHEYDQFVESKQLISQIMKGDRIDVCIDDGFHSNETILKTMSSVMPFLSSDFVYFIEDNKNVITEIKSIYPQLKVKSFGRLTVVTNV